MSDIDRAMLQSMAASFRGALEFSFNRHDMAELMDRCAIRADLTPPAADYVAGLRAASARCKLEVENCRQLESFRNEASELYFDGLADAQIVIDRLAEDALAARPASPDTRVVPRPEAVDALAAYQQADMDGIMVLVSRQAIEECLPSLRAIIGGQDRG